MRLFTGLPYHWQSAQYRARLSVPSVSEATQLTHLEAGMSLLHLLQLPLLPPHLPRPQEGRNASWQQQDCPVQPAPLWRALWREARKGSKCQGVQVCPQGDSGLLSLRGSDVKPQLDHVAKECYSGLL